MVTGLLFTYIPNFGPLSWIWRCKEHPCPFSPDLENWRTLEVPDWGLVSSSWFWYGHLSLIHQWSGFSFYILIFKVQRTSTSLKSWFVAMEDTGGSWPGFLILFLISIWSFVFDTQIFEFWLFLLILKVCRSSMSFNCWFVALQDPGGSWLFSALFGHLAVFRVKQKLSKLD